MLVAPLLAVSLVASVATGPVTGLGQGPHWGPHWGSDFDRPAVGAVQPLVRAVTDCIVKTIAADPRARQGQAGTMLGELIVDSMPACAARVRAMIDAYDASYGDGTGEAFFMGPYLDGLPTAAAKMLRTAPSAR